MVDDRIAKPLSLRGTELQPPLGELTRVELDEATVARLWANIDRRTSDVGRGGGCAAGERRWIWGTAAALAMAAAGALLWVRAPLDTNAAPDAPSGETASSSPALASGNGGAGAVTAPSTGEAFGAQRGPLLTADGAAFEVLEAQKDGEPQRVALADGSVIEASPGARVEALASTSDQFSVLLRQGRARLSIAPGGARRWSLDTRGARVEVVGTVFSVESSAAGVKVEVEKGIVLVRSMLLREGVRRLAAGERLELPAPETPRQPAVPSASQLWEEADQARQNGDPQRAARQLRRLIEVHPRDAEAPLAAFTLGLMELEQLREPAAAARSLRRALDLGLPSALREDAHRRLGQALQQLREEAAATGNDSNPPASR